MKFASPILSFWSVECELKKFGDTLADILSKLVKIFSVKIIRATLQTKMYSWLQPLLCEKWCHDPKDISKTSNNKNKSGLSLINR